MSEHLPATIGKYRVVRELGRGATSVVYLGEDAFHKRRVAIKSLRLDGAGDNAMQRRYRRVFLNEAALAGKLAHPHIISIFDAVSEGDESYLVMEFVEGGTLENYTSSSTLLPLERLVEIIFKASLALDHAHRSGVIHCDIKPANILIAGSTDIKVSDFGAAFYDNAEHTYLTGVGSPAYMSPEQVLEKELTHQTDIYSLGVVLYQLLTGRLPFQGSNRASLLYQILNIDPPAPSVHRPDVPAELDRIVIRAIAKDTATRYQHWGEMSRDLAHAFKHLTLPEESVSDTEKFTALRALDFFREFRDIEIWEALRISAWHRHAPNTVIVQEGTPGDGFMVLTAGEAFASRQGTWLDVLKPGACFGDLLYFEKSPRDRATTVTTHSACVSMEIKARTLREASDRLQAQFDRAFMRILTLRLDNRETRILRGSEKAA